MESIHKHTVYHYFKKKNQEIIASIKAFLHEGSADNDILGKGISEFILNRV